MRTRLRAALAVLLGRPVAYRLTFMGSPAWEAAPGLFVGACRFTR